MDSSRAVRWVAWGLLGAAILFSLGVRCRLLDFPLERDEGEYAYAGQLLLHGVPPYQLAYNMKLPGTYLAYAAGMAVFGQTVAGVHLTLLAANLATIVLLFVLAKDLFDSLAGGFAALSFAILSVEPSVLGMAAHATHFVALFGVAGAWLLWRAASSDHKCLHLAAGLLLGLAFLMKQQGVFLIVFGAAAILVCGWLSQSRDWRKIAIGVTLVSCGAVLPYLATCLWLWHAGVFGRFWFWTVSYARQYVQQVSAREAWMCFQNTFVNGIVVSAWPLWVAAAVGLISVGLGRYDRRAKWFAYLFLVFAFLCVCPGFFFRQHYFIVWLPAAALFAGAACSQFIAVAGRPLFVNNNPQPAGRRAKKQQAAPAPAEAFKPLVLVAGLIVAGGFCVTVFGTTTPNGMRSQDYFFSTSPTQLCRLIYFGNPFAESEEIADFLRSHSKPNQTIAVIGSEPQLYFLSGRVSATGFIYVYPLMENQTFAVQMQHDMAKEVEQAKPEFLVFANVPCSWLMKPDSNTYLFNWVQSYVEKNYRLVGLVNIMPPMQPMSFCWDAAQAGFMPISRFGHLRIFQLQHKSL